MEEPVRRLRPLEPNGEPQRYARLFAARENRRFLSEGRWNPERVPGAIREIGATPDVHDVLRRYARERRRHSDLSVLLEKEEALRAQARESVADRSEGDAEASRHFVGSGPRARLHEVPVDGELHLEVDIQSFSSPHGFDRSPKWCLRSRRE